jgi:hypothetical protein
MTKECLSQGAYQPIAQPSVLRPDQIVCSLRPIGLPECRGDRRMPLSAVAPMTGLSRLTLYRAQDSDRLSANMRDLLSPIVPAFAAGKRRFRRMGRYGDQPNCWEIIETRADVCCIVGRWHQVATNDRTRSADTQPAADDCRRSSGR